MCEIVEFLHLRSPVRLDVNPFGVVTVILAISFTNTFNTCVSASSCHLIVFFVLEWGVKCEVFCVFQYVSTLEFLLSIEMSLCEIHSHFASISGRVGDWERCQTLISDFLNSWNLLMLRGLHHINYISRSRTPISDEVNSCPHVWCSGYINTYCKEIFCHSFAERFRYQRQICTSVIF